MLSFSSRKPSPLRVMPFSSSAMIRSSCRFTPLRCPRSERHAIQTVDPRDRILPEPRLIDRPQGFDLVILLLRRGVEEDQDVRLLANDTATAAPLSLAVEQREPVGKPHGDLVVNEALPLGVGHRWKRFAFGAEQELCPHHR